MNVNFETVYIDKTPFFLDTSSFVVTESRLCTYHASDAQGWMESTDHELGIKLQEITLLSWDYFANMTDDTLAKVFVYDRF